MTALPTRYRRLLVPLLGPRTTGTLPTQINNAIEEQENRGEILVKLIQLLIVSIWGILYAVSPKAETGGIALAPYAIGLYLAVNSVGLVWAVKRRLPDWAVYFSIFFDMLLLFAVIWSFHVQYRQPPAFYLKAPTIMYMFVFIALRALRFQPRFVLAAGGAAALGWLAMILYVVLSDPEHATITRNYVAYMTGNLILIGAEIDKIIAILMVTGILALSLYRGRDLLIRATSETAAARSLSRFFDNSIVEDIRSGENAIAAGEGMARDAAILNVDIRGFSRLRGTHAALRRDPDTSRVPAQGRANHPGQRRRHRQIHGRRDHGDLRRGAPVGPLCSRRTAHGGRCAGGCRDMA